MLRLLRPETPAKGPNPPKRRKGSRSPSLMFDA